MTAVLQATRSGTLLPLPMPVHSVNEGKVFLVMERCAGGVLIRRSTRAGRKLNNFWQVWARELLLEAESVIKYKLRIRLKTRGLRITSYAPPEKWAWTVANLLARITPLARPPMWENESRGVVDDDRWKVHPRADLTEVVQNLELPQAVSRYFTVSGGVRWVYLDRRGTDRRQCIFPISEVRLMVEKRIAHECHFNGVPLLQDAPRIWVPVTSSL